jgi:hypothetical protein
MLKPLLIAFCSLLICECAVAQGKIAAQSGRVPQGRRELLRSRPVQTPEWKDTLPQNATEIYFVGASHAFATETDARQAARDDAFNQILNYYGRFIQSTGIEKSSVQGSSSDILAPYIERVDEIKSFAENIVSQVNADKYYTEFYINEQDKEECIVWVLCQISREKVKHDIDTFAKKTSERYDDLIKEQTTLASALEAYSYIYKALNDNPLHRAVAVSANGKTGLYEYCALQINTLAGSVSFAPIPSATVQKGGTFNGTIKLTSTLFNEIGTVNCRITLAGRNVGAPDHKIPLGKNNSLTVPVLTTSPSISPGTYVVHLELLLNEIAPLIRQNPGGSFTLEVTPITASVKVTFTGDAIKGFDFAKQNSATEDIRNSIQKGIQNSNIPIIIDETGKYTFEVSARMKSYPTSGLVSCTTLTITLLDDRRKMVKNFTRNEEGLGKEYDRDIDRIFRDLIAPDISGSGWTDYFNSLFEVLNISLK